MKKPLVILIILAILFLLVFVLITQTSRDVELVEDVAGELTSSLCEQASGSWNACGSACRTQPEAPCIELCVAYCECELDDQCPVGYACGDFVDGQGVCLES